jgi:hypothetical protein
MTFADSEIIYTTMEQEDKIRTMMWAIDMFADRTSLKGKINGNDIEIQKLAGCPFYCGFKMQMGKESATVSGLYKHYITRKITYTNNTMKQIAIDWINSNPDVEFSRELTPIIRKGVSLTMLADRLAQSKDTLIDISLFNAESYTTSGVKNTNRFKSICTAYGIKFNSKTIKYVKHDIVLKKSEMWFSKDILMYTATGARNIISNSAELWSIVNDDIDKLLTLNIVGAKAMIMSMAQHSQYNTTVAKAWTKANNAEHIKTLINREEVLRLSANATKELTEYEPDFEKVIITSVTDSAISMWGEILETIGVHKVMRAGSATKVIYASIDPSIVATQHMFYPELTQPKINAGITSLYIRGSKLANELRLNLIQHTGAGTSIAPTYNNAGVRKNSVIWYGLALVAMDDETILDDLSNNNQVYGWLPIKTESEHIYKLHDKQMSVNGVAYSFKTNECRMRNAFGKTECITSKRLLSYQTLLTCGDFNMVRYVLKQKYTPNKILSINSSLTNTDNVFVDLPMLNFDIIKILNGEPIIRSQHLRINKRLYHLCMKRCMTGTHDLTSLLSFARAATSTMNLTSTGMSYRDSQDIDVIMSTAYAVHISYTHTQNT